MSTRLASWVPEHYVLITVTYAYSQMDALATSANSLSEVEPPYFNLLCIGALAQPFAAVAQSSCAWNDTVLAPLAGLAGWFITEDRPVSQGGCGIPFNLANIEDLLLLLGDKVADAECQLRFEPEGVHERSLYGDINLVSGVPWPRMLLEPKWYRMKFLNAATSRPWLIKYKDDFGKDVGHEVCVVYATDDGA
jgi:hypothetical protein